MDISTILTVGWRLAALVLGIGHWGWWLAALVAPKSAVLVAGLLVVYGLGVGWGSVVPASGVIAMAITLVVAFDIFPPFWADNLHYKYWAYTVLLLWATSIAVVCLLAAVVLLLGFNLALSTSVLMLAYLVKSALGINLMPGHFRGFAN